MLAPLQNNWGGGAHPRPHPSPSSSYAYDQRSLLYNLSAMLKLDPVIKLLKISPGSSFDKNKRAIVPLECTQGFIYDLTYRPSF